MKNLPTDRKTEDHNSTQLDSSSSDRDNHLNPRPDWWPEEWPWPPEFERSTSSAENEAQSAVEYPNSSVSTKPSA
jgi:hypothetical protein